MAVNALSPVLVPETASFDANVSHWSLALAPAGPPLDRDLDADLVIIGGGLTGLSTAWHLRQVLPGRKVVLLEARRCGNGASGRNGAMLLTMTGDRYLEWHDTPEIDRRLYALTAGNIDALVALTGGVGVDAEFSRCGAVHVASTAHEYQRLAAYVSRAREAGLPFELWNSERTATALGTRAYCGAVFDPGGAQAHPGKVVAALRAACLAAGVEVYEDTPVIDVAEGTTLVLTTAHGRRVRAPAAVLATNAYTSKLGYLRSRVVPIHDYVAITAPLTSDRINALGWVSRAPFDDGHTEVYYLGLTRDNRVHIGGGPVDYSYNNGVRDRRDGAARYAGLHRELVRLYPTLAEVPFERGWGGLVDMSLDESPALGQGGVHGNLYYALGFSGHGFNMSTLFGRIIADLVAGGHDRWRWLPYLDRLPPPLPNEPYRWLGIRAALAGIRAFGL